MKYICRALKVAIPKVKDRAMAQRGSERGSAAFFDSRKHLVGTPGRPKAHCVATNPQRSESSFFYALFCLVWAVHSLYQRRTIAVPPLVHLRISLRNPKMKRRRYGAGTALVRRWYGHMVFVKVRVSAWRLSLHRPADSGLENRQRGGEAEQGLTGAWRTASSPSLPGLRGDTPRARWCSSKTKFLSLRRLPYRNDNQPLGYESRAFRYAPPWHSSRGSAGHAEGRRGSVAR